MFVKNTTDKDIPSDGVGITCGGYFFTLPAGKVCAIWDEAGKLITNDLFKVESKTGGVDPITGKPDSAMFPPVIVADRSDWDGKTYAKVEKFKIEKNVNKITADGSNLEKLILLAEERGVDETKVRKFQYAASQGQLDIMEVAKAIDALPVPEQVIFPEKPDIGGDDSKESKPEE